MYFKQKQDLIEEFVTYITKGFVIITNTFRLLDSTNRYCGVNLKHCFFFMLGTLSIF